MRILFVNRMLGVAWGGGENYDCQLACQLEALGHQVTFLTSRVSKCPAARPDTGIETIAVESPYLRRWMYRLGGKLPLVPGMIAELDLELFRRQVLRRVGVLRRERSFDVVQVLALPWLAGDFARLGLPVVMRLPGPPAWFQAPLLRRLAANPRTAMFSHGDTVRMLRSRWRIDICEVPPGVRSDFYAPAAPAERSSWRERLQVPDQAFVVTSVGRLVPGKGQKLLIRSMPEMVKQIPGLVVVIVGDGPLHRQLEREAESLGLAAHLRFTGHQDREGVRRWLAASDVFALCSEYENYSNAVLEAMATGLPVVATRTGGFPLQINDGVNGFLVEPGDSYALAAAIARLSMSRELLMRIGGAGRRFAAGFSWRATAERTLGIYERLLAR